MRAIIYRAKTKYDPMWVKGYYAGEDCDLPFSKTVKRDSIILQGSGLWAEVQSDTLGESTGYVDCGGVEIFEGDIIEYEDIRGVVKFGEYDQNLGFYIDWIAAKPRSFDGLLRNDFIFWVKKRVIAVIGNVHDSPELANLPVKISRIVYPPKNSKGLISCSVCGQEIAQLCVNFCGNCGARLIGGENGENNDQR